MELRLLSGINSPAELKELPLEKLEQLAEEIRWAICDQMPSQASLLSSDKYALPPADGRHSLPRATNEARSGVSVDRKGTV
mgnify:CR=1 FL=1